MHSASDKFIKIKSSMKLLVHDNGILCCQPRLHETENLSFNHYNAKYNSSIWSIIIQYNDTLDEIIVIACQVKKKAKETDQW